MEIPPHTYHNKHTDYFSLAVLWFPQIFSPWLSVSAEKSFLLKKKFYHLICMQNQNIKSNPVFVNSIFNLCKMKSYFTHVFIISVRALPMNVLTGCFKGFLQDCSSFLGQVKSFPILTDLLSLSQHEDRKNFNFLALS